MSMLLSFLLCYHFCFYVYRSCAVPSVHYFLPFSVCVFPRNPMIQFSKMTWEKELKCLGSFSPIYLFTRMGSPIDFVEIWANERWKGFALETFQMFANILQDLINSFIFLLSGSCLRVFRIKTFQNHQARGISRWKEEGEIIKQHC